MGIGIVGAAFIGAIVGMTAGGIRGGHAGALKGGLMGAAGGALGAGVAGAFGGAAGAAGAPGGATFTTGGMIASAPAGVAGGVAPASVYGGLSSAFLETAIPTAMNTAQTGIGAIVEGAPATTGSSWSSLINPAINVAGRTASILLQPDAPDFPQPIAPPLIKETDPLAMKKFEETPEAIDARIAREGRADEMYGRARAMEALRRTSVTQQARGQGGYTFDEYFQKPRTAGERFIGVSPTIGAARH